MRTIRLHVASIPAAAAAPGPDRARPAAAPGHPSAAATALLSLFVLWLIPGTAAAPADVFGLIWFFVLTARLDLAPPPRH